MMLLLQHSKFFGTKCVFLAHVRKLATTDTVYAGFQGVKGTGSANEVLQGRLERKKRLIKKLQNQALELKPVKDFTIRYSWKLPEKERSPQQLSADELEKRVLLQKEWSKYVLQRTKAENDRLHGLKESQERALYELKQASEKLYQAAIEPDIDAFPLTVEGPSETPPLKNYLSPLGGMEQWEET